MPSALTNVNAVTRSQLGRYLGSFWNSLFQNREQVAWLLELTQKSQAGSMLQSAVDDLAGNYAAASQVAQVSVAFQAREVIATGMLLYDDPELDLSYLDQTDYAALYNFFRLSYFILPVREVVPQAIQSASQGLLTIGVDFFVLKNSYIFFRQDPRLLFPGGAYLVVSGQRLNYADSLSYLTRVPGGENRDYVTQYLRRHQTPKALRLALAALGGLAILRQPQRLQARQQVLATTIYVFETEVLRVSYPHEPLVVGQAYPADFVIGSGVQVFQADPDRPGAWWRQVDWRGGLSLDPLVQDFKGLALLDRETVAYVAGQDAGSVTGSRVHVRVKLSDSFFAEEPYWLYVADRETSSGFYLNSLLHLPEDAGVADPSVLDTFAKLRTAITAANLVNRQLNLPPEDPDLAALPNSIRVNALDLFFQAVLGDTAFVVVFDLNQIPSPAPLFDFLSREMLIGGTPVIYAYGPDLPVENIQTGDTMAVDEAMTHAAATVLNLQETVDMGNSVSDRVSLQAQRPVRN